MLWYLCLNANSDAVFEEASTLLLAAHTRFTSEMKASVEALHKKFVKNVADIIQNALTEMHDSGSLTLTQKKHP